MNQNWAFQENSITASVRPKTDLTQYNNSWYDTGGSAWKRLLWYFANVFFLKNHWNPFSSLKVAVLRLFGAKIGRRVTIKPGVNIKYPWRLEIGDHSWIGEEVWIDNLVPVRIGANCCLSQGAMLLTGNHNYKKPTFDLMVEGITLEDGVWIGAKATVCPGVVCRSHAVLGVQSVATRNLSPYRVYQGNPARPVRERIMESDGDLAVDA